MYQQYIHLMMDVPEPVAVALHVKFCVVVEIIVSSVQIIVIGVSKIHDCSRTIKEQSGM